MTVLGNWRHLRIYIIPATLIYVGIRRYEMKLFHLSKFLGCETYNSIMQKKIAWIIIFSVHFSGLAPSEDLPLLAQDGKPYTSVGYGNGPGYQGSDVDYDNINREVLTKEIVGKIPAFFRDISNLSFSRPLRAIPKISKLCNEWWWYFDAFVRPQFRFMT